MKDVFVMVIQLLQFIAAERRKFDAETNYEKTLRRYNHRDADGIDALRHLYGWHLWNWLYDQYKPVRVVAVCCATVMAVAFAVACLLAIVFPYGW